MSAEQDVWGIRHVALFCDKMCGKGISGKGIDGYYRATNREDAFADLRQWAAGAGWVITADADTCPNCRTP